MAPKIHSIAKRICEGRRRLADRFQPGGFRGAPARFGRGIARNDCRSFSQAAWIPGCASTRKGSSTYSPASRKLAWASRRRYAQIVAEELDVPVDRVVLVMGDTASTANQGGVGGSTSIMLGSKPLRNAAANARYLLTQLASQRLGVPAEQLEVKDGVVQREGRLRRKASRTRSSPAPAI